MRLVKLLLIVTLFTCTTWAGAIFLGPTLITVTLDRLAPGRVEIERIEVSPKLDISASMIAFSMPDGRGGEVSGFLRGVRATWSLENGFAVNVEIGPSQIPGLGTVSALEATLRPTSVTHWEDAGITAAFEDLRIEFPSWQMQSETGSAGARLSLSQMSLSELRLGLNQSELALPEGNARAAMAAVKVDRYDLKRAPPAQDLTYDFDFSQGASFDGSQVSSLSAAGTLDGEMLIFDGRVTGVSLPPHAIEANEVSLSGSYDLRREAFGPELQLQAEAVSVPQADAKFASVSGKVQIPQGANKTASLSGRARLERAEISAGTFFIGELDGGEIDLFGETIPRENGVTQGVSIQLGYSAPRNIKATLSAELDLHTPSLLACVERDCKASRLSANYTISVDGESIRGVSECSGPTCGAAQFNHKISTEDTNAFFQNLMGVSGLNPLLIQILYAEMRRGAASGSAHVLEF